MRNAGTPPPTPKKEHQKKEIFKNFSLKKKKKDCRDT